MYADLTVRENLTFFARVLGADAASVDRGHRAGRPRPTTPTRSSAGSAAASCSRASLAVALLGSPDLLVLDEPTVGLDPVLRRDLWALFHRLADAGAAVFVSSHVMDEADRCDRLLLMREGRIIADDTPDRHPRADRHRRRRERLPGPGRRGRRRGERRMTPRILLAVTARVLTQLRRDRRTVGDAARPAVRPDHPAVVDVQGPPGDLFDRFGPGLLAIFPFIVMFLVTSVTTLRERSSGTLERLLAMPMGKLDFLGGYALAFGVVATVQAALAVALSVGLLGLDVAGPVWLLGLVAVADAVLGTALGLFVSAFAQTEFQAVQFMPLFVIPQILLCGLFVPRDELPAVLQRDQRRAPALLRHRRDAGARSTAPRPPRSGATSASSRRSPWRPSRSARRPCGGVRRSHAATGAGGPTK